VVAAGSGGVLRCCVRSGPIRPHLRGPGVSTALPARGCLWLLPLLPVSWLLLILGSLHLFSVQFLGPCSCVVCCSTGAALQIDREM
jgi:hypothetical protein